MSDSLKLNPATLSSLISLQAGKHLVDVAAAFNHFGFEYGLALSSSRYAELEKAAASDGVMHWKDADPENDIEAGFYAGAAPAPAPAPAPEPVAEPVAETHAPVPAPEV